MRKQSISDMLNIWENDFRSTAEHDAYNSFRDHLDYLGLDGDPVSMLEGTVKLTRMSAAYYCMDNQPIESYLKHQVYHPSAENMPPYIYTFDLFGKAFARAFDSSEHALIDLADLFNCPWDEYKVAGYYQFWISRTDHKPLLVKEIRKILKLIKADLFFDYGKGDIILNTSIAPDQSHLNVIVEET